MRIRIVAALAAFSIFSAPLAFAQASPSPNPSASPVAMASPVAVAAPAKVSVVSPTDFFSQVMSTIQKFGGASTMLKIALIVMLIVSSMKVTVINQLFWSKLGVMQTWMAPLLGLIAGLLDLAGSGQLSLASVAAYVSAGAGAIILHELLDSIKALPGIGPVWVSLIEFIEKHLGGPAAAEAAPVPPAGNQ